MENLKSPLKPIGTINSMILINFRFPDLGVLER